MSEQNICDTPPSVVAAAAEPLQKKQASSAAPVSQCTGQGISECARAPVDVGNEGMGTFGSRMLSSDRNVFEYNAWDHVEPDDEHLKYAEEQIRLHHEHPVPKDKREKYNTQPAAFWDSFYENNNNKFFKDRHWLRIEFAELFEWTTSRKSAEESNSISTIEAIGVDAVCVTASKNGMATEVAIGEKFRIMEVGCGAGNAVFPLLADIYDPRLFVYACDYSKAAVDVVKSSDTYDESRCSAFVWDLSSTELPSQVAPGCIDVLLMVFVFSALHPDQWSQAVENAYRLLKPGGILLFRDYGRNDLTQLRFKKSRLLEDNLYIRGDGTRVYFFTNEELATIFGKRFIVRQNAIDRRLLVNRKRELKMYRVWLQAKFCKPINKDN
ncbi:hypothetical protein GGI25_000295 [Coemansia spiralis]|uniref:tRNA N(3)-methylcytidine methyltransferase n=2 Tax=Coemansia TaxID=4863 RepID=A0A9W8G8M7_9FUNG|nr:hypothetical protein EDC05_000487 [Coemansia umbellata]KAJ2625867.1 hypothetical protein GGI26_000330 [Coemansia sp. RSA 1358]KAJ2680989.1 hypothetical protein GGI25_000295 [Coemansia spiralis]